MNDKVAFGLGGFVVGMVLATLLSMWGHFLDMKHIQRAAINHGAAIHDPVSGEFTWNGEAAK